MILKRAVYFLFFAFCIWLAFATRKYSFFHPLVVEYGGDIAWSGAFLFLLRCLFIKTKAWKLSLVCYILGVLDECSQLLTHDWIVAARATYIGRLMLGVGFLWSDLICYAIGTLSAFVTVLLIDRFFARKGFKRA